MIVLISDGILETFGLRVTATGLRFSIAYRDLVISSANFSFSSKSGAFSVTTLNVSIPNVKPSLDILLTIVISI